MDDHPILLEICREHHEEHALCFGSCPLRLTFEETRRHVPQPTSSEKWWNVCLRLGSRQRRTVPMQWLVFAALLSFLGALHAHVPKMMEVSNRWCLAVNASLQVRNVELPSSDIDQQTTELNVGTGASAHNMLL